MILFIKVGYCHVNVCIDCNLYICFPFNFKCYDISSTTTLFLFIFTLSNFASNMGLSLRLNCSAAIHSPQSFNNSPIRLLPSSAGGRETTFNSAKLSSLSTVYEEGETFQKNFPRAFSCLSSALDNASLETEEIKVNKGRRSISGVDEVIDNTQIRLLMENLGTLEETLQLRKFGALELSDACLLRSLEPSHTLDFASTGHPDQVREHKKNSKVDDYMDKVFVQSSRKKQSKARKKRAFTAMEVLPQSSPLKSDRVDLLRFPLSSVNRVVSKCEDIRVAVARREAEMSKAVKVLAELEKIRAAIEECTKQVASMSSWAKASGVDEKVLQQTLHYGQYCRDELIRSTRSLVLYLARRYRGSGIALEDLLQAGYVGVLRGAERFDCTRGYRFSTYVQYWIRKSMSRMVTRYGRGIVIPWSLNRAINQIRKAQKSLKRISAKFPDDYEIAKMTGLSLDKIRSASKCLRVVASNNQKTGDCLSINYLELMPDTSVGSPEEAVMKQHMRKDLYDLLKGLDSRERQIVTLRFGLSDHHPRTLEDIGKHFKVSKEWVRRIEKKALTKLRNKATISNLNFYLDL